MPDKLDEIEQRWNALPKETKAQYAAIIADIGILLTRLKAAELICEASKAARLMNSEEAIVRLDEALATWEAAQG